MNTIVNVTGFGWSGSGAVFDLLREYEDINILDNKGEDLEFILLSEKDGIRDLDFGLNDNNYRLNSSSYISRFLELVDFLSEKMGYESVFNGQFKKLSLEYINSLIEYSFQGWTFDDLRHPLKANRWRNIFNYGVKHVFDNRITTHFRLCRKICNKLTVKVRHSIHVSYYPKDFLRKTEAYLNSLFSFHIRYPSCPLVVDQLFPPDKPALFFKYYRNSKSIVVRRDPRDVYLLAKCAISYMAVPLPIENVDDFITFYKEVISETLIPDTNNILSINFEDMIYNYENTVNRIEDFLDLKIHKRPQAIFNPSVSINNTQLFRKYTEYAKEIEKISNELSESLYPFERYEYKRTSSEVF